jgi:predicted DNA-binding transcriptional regulator YafY
MTKAKIYIASKNAMQSGKNKHNAWVLEFNKSDTSNDHLMNWTSTDDTQYQVKLNFDSKEEAINFAQKKNIDFEVVEPKSAKIILKSYADNFTS